MINISSLANFLSINSEDIDEIETVSRADAVYIYIKMKRRHEICPECESEKKELKEYKIRKIKHDLFQNKPTIFLLKYRRFKCLSCCKTFSETNNFAPKRSRNTFQTIFRVLELAKSYTNTWKDIAEKTFISDTAAINIFDTYVNIKRGKLPSVLCIDECYNKHQFSKPYSCVLFDFDKSLVVDIFEDRSKYNLTTYFGKISKEERQNVDYVIIDMWRPYLDISQFFFPNAIVAIDSFHVIKEMGFALDKVRRRIVRGYDKKTWQYRMLKAFNFTLFKDYNYTDEKFKVKILNKWLNCYEIKNILIGIDKDLAIATKFYSLYRLFNQTSTIETAEIYLERFINNAEIINVKEFVPIIAMLQNWKEWIINSFIVVNGRRLSNGPIEGFNSSFKKLMTIANGLFTFERFRNRLIYCYNKPVVISPAKEKIVKPGRKKRGKYKKTAKS